MVNGKTIRAAEEERRMRGEGGGCQPGECAALPPMECRGTFAARPRQQGGWLANWPLKIQLVPPNAPYLEGARLVIVADCVPFVDPGFRERVEPGRVVLAACPKLGDAWFNRAKLAQILSPNKIEEIEVLHVDVPCCAGLVRIVRQAMKDARCGAPVRFGKIGLNGGPARPFVMGENAGASPAEKTRANGRADVSVASK